MSPSPIDILKELIFSVAALAELGGKDGSYEKRQARLCYWAIRVDIERVIKLLEDAGEGK